MTLPPYTAIVGAGYCGCAMAAELSSRGGAVVLHSTPDHQRHLADSRGKGAFTSEAEVTGHFHPALTTGIDETLGAADYVVITVPSYGHNDVLALLCDPDLARHTLAFINGTVIALRAARELNAKAVLETNASPFASRVVDSTVRVSGIKNDLPIGGLPGVPDPETVSDIEAIFPGTLDWYENVLKIGMQSNNGGNPPTRHAAERPLNRDHRQ